MLRIIRHYPRFRSYRDAAPDLAAICLHRPHTRVWHTSVGLGGTVLSSLPCIVTTGENRGAPQDKAGSPDLQRPSSVATGLHQTVKVRRRPAAKGRPAIRTWAKDCRRLGHSQFGIPHPIQTALPIRGPPLSLPLRWMMK